MTYYLTYQIKWINGQFVMPIHQEDNVKFITSRIKKEFGIIPKLSARIYGSELQSTNILSQCVRNQDVVTFDVKDAPKNENKLEFYRQPIITPRYQSKTTFIVFTTINFQSMINGNKIQVDVEQDDIKKLQDKIKEMLKKNYKHHVNDRSIKSMRILLFLPGGIPFLKGKINDFITSFQDYMPHLYAIIIYNKNIDDKLLDKTFDNVCNISTNEMKLLISPDYDNNTYGLCQIASVLGYIQQNGQGVKRMIYSIAKFCPFSPLICGLYSLSTLSRATGRTIIQITAPLLQLFTFMGNSFEDQSNIFSYTVKFLTYFMNIKISDRVPCTEFIRPFYAIGFEKYFHDIYKDDDKIESVIAFDPDFRDQDWIRFELKNLTEEDYQDAMNHTKTLDIIPPMSLRERHRVSLFNGQNGPWLFLTASVSKEETEKDKIDFINPEKGCIEHDTYENISIMSTGIDYKKDSRKFDEAILDSIDPEKVTQLVFIVIDKSGSMRSPFGGGFSRFQASQKFFIKFTKACYRYHTTSLYGSIMFNDGTEVRNKLNPLVNNFEERMIIEGERAQGGTRMFTAMKKGAELMIEANRGNKYPNAIFRLIVISDGYDGCQKSEMANVSNFLLQNKVRVDAIIVSNQIAKELVAISRFSGGIAIFPRSLEEGLELFNKEEFFNVNLRKFGPIRSTEVTENEIRGLPQISVNELDRVIQIKTNEYIDTQKLVTSPKYAVSEYEKALSIQIEGSKSIHEIHPNQKRIINELKKIISNQDEDIRVFPLKDRIDVWRILIKFDGSLLYSNRWFYMIVEFPPEYPQHYPLFRFVKPPFHPNITDQGRVCIDAFDQIYKNNMTVLELIGHIKTLMMIQPSFDSCVDLRRQQLADNKEEFERIVKKWNEDNGKDSPEDWEKDWKIQPDGVLFKGVESSNTSIVPPQYRCPITNKIMREPVKASSGVYYEKSALENYVNITPNATCRAKVDSNKKPIPLPKDKNIGLKVDNELKTKIAKWIKDNDYREDEEEGDEDENIIYFRRSGEKIAGTKYVNLFKSGGKPSGGSDPSSSTNQFNRPSSRPRPFLSDK